MNNLDTIYQYVHQWLSTTNRQWRGGVPDYDSVKQVIDNMISIIKESSSSISVESGGVLVKRTDDYIDVYVHAGGVK